ncbi:MAG: sulfatase [Candidatus Aminicenantes bacterium]|nr:sulfatase [Candidatus Aminicenantes bacterium]
MSDFSLRLGRAACAAVCLGALALPACRKDGPAEIAAIRFTDALTAAGIVASPLGGPGASAPDERAYPMQSTVMPESGRGEDPLGLKRRVNLGLSDIQILFAPPRSEYECALPLTAAGRLDFGVGIIRDANSIAVEGGAADGAAGVNFLVILESRGRKKVLFEQHLDMPATRESRTVNYAWHSIQVPARDEAAIIRLVTAGQKGAFGFWHAPVFVVPTLQAPNVVLISIDTLRPDHLGAYGYGRPVSPAIDALAAESALFRNVYSTASWTLPAHVSMMTGLNGIRHRVFFEDDRMNPRISTLAEKMRDKGYATHAVTGAGFVSAPYGFAKGFDEYGMSQVDINDPDLAGAAGKEAVEWVERIGDRPFFLFLHTYQVHCPYKSPRAIQDVFLKPNPHWRSFDVSQDLGGRAGIFKPMSESDRDNIVGLYDAGVRTTDENMIKPLLDFLRRKGIYDRTLIVLTSDHGDEFYEHGGWNHTHNLYDELIRVPLIIKMPAGTHAGQRLDPIVRLTDIMPTILDIVGAPYDPAAIDGRSLMPVLEGQETADRVFQAEFAEDVVEVNIPQRVAVNQGKLKLVLNQPYSEAQLKFFAYPPRIPTAVELFDLQADPGEQRDIDGEPGRAEIVRTLVRRAQEIGALIPKREKGRSKIDPELERQLRALGYIR